MEWRDPISKNKGDPSILQNGTEFYFVGQCGLNHGFYILKCNNYGLVDAVSLLGQEWPLPCGSELL